MNKSKLVFLLTLTVIPILGLGQEQMTAARFREIVSAPGDSIPLIAKLSETGPLWTNAAVSITLKFESGKTFEEKAVETVRTVKGKYIVTTVDSKFYNQPMQSIMTYDEQASAYKVWGLFGETVTEGRVVYDLSKKLTAMTCAYGDGFTELGVGSYSSTQSSSRTSIFKNGVLFCTREASTTPVTKSK
jgi:hypothetical protein